MDVGQLLDKNNKQMMITGVVDPIYIKQQDFHREVKSYRDWRFDGLDFEDDVEGLDRFGMTNRPSHNLLHINYDDVLFEDFK